MNQFLALDRHIFLVVNLEWTHPVLDFVMTRVTDFHLWRVPVIVLLLLFLARSRTNTRVAILFAILAVALTDQIIASGLKPLFHRVRPFEAIEGTRRLVGAYDWSFPSAHAGNSSAAAVFLALRFRRLWPILILPVVISYSRVYVGVHYPTDVAAGAALGAFVGLAFVALERAVRTRFGRGPQHTPESPE